MEEQADRRWIILAVFARGRGRRRRRDPDLARRRRRRRLDAPTARPSADGCKQVEAPEPKKVSFKAPKQVLKQGEEATAVVETSCGTFEIALDTKRAPKTANSFAYLAEEGFYDDLTFHRIVPGFVIQGGDPDGTGTGGPGYSVDEKPPANLAYTKGIVAMAKSSAEPPGTLRQPVLRRHRRRRRPAARIRAGRQGQRGLRRGRADRQARARRTKNRNRRS